VSASESEKLLRLCSIVYIQTREFSLGMICLLPFG
jgi:hypothetical protein